MRLIISSSGMMVIIILIVIIHNSIISDNYCNMEMNSSINGALIMLWIKCQMVT